MSTDRLYYDDAYRTSFTASIVERLEVDGRPVVVLDRTMFYPTSGGQLCDRGVLNGVPVTKVAEEGETIIHFIDGTIEDDSVEGTIDWPHRYDHMQQHTGQRLPAEVGEVTTELTLNLIDLLPHNTHHFSYQGSLTTPPCSEGVQWIVLKTPITISKVQADRFFTTIGPNARPVQPLQHRDILEHR